MIVDHNLGELTRRVLEQGYLISLGIVDEEGPWVADVIYTFDDDFNVYWMSKPHRRHSVAIGSRANVAGAITVTSAPGVPDFGVQLFGNAEPVEVVPSVVVSRYFAKRHKPEPAPNDDILGEHLWYRLIPSRIELIDQEHFGFDRQRVR